MNNETNHEDLIKAAIGSYGLKQEIARLHKENMKAVEGASSPVIRMMRPMMKIAASLLILIIAGSVYFYFNSTSEQLFNDAFISYSPVTTRGENADRSIDSRTALFNRAYEYLQKQELDSSIAILQRIRNDAGAGSIAENADYYLALAYLRNHQASKALTIFKKIAGDVDHPYYKEVSSWLLWKVRFLAWKQE
jgi:TolA-binding protein